MPPPEDRSPRLLAAEEGSRWPAALLGAVALAAAWAGWLGWADLPVRVSAERAHLEPAGGPIALAAAAAGRVAAVQVRLGDAVLAGDPLLCLDDRDARERLRSAGQARAALHRQLSAIDAEIDAAGGALAAARRADRAGAVEARQTAASAAAAARVAEDRARRDRALIAAGLLPASETARLAGDDEQRRAAAAARAAAGDRQAWAGSAAAADRRSQLAALSHDRARLCGELVAAAAAETAAARDLDRLVVRAPEAGRIADLVALPLGAYLPRGAPLGSLLPAGRRRVVAFLSAATWERVRPGQPAAIELPGRRRPALAATVSRIAGELRDGVFRVELELQPGAGGDLPAGLPVRAEIETGRAAPALQLWRALVPRQSAPGTPARLAAAP